MTEKISNFFFYHSFFFKLIFTSFRIIFDRLSKLSMSLSKPADNICAKCYSTTRKKSSKKLKLPNGPLNRWNVLLHLRSRCGEVLYTLFYHSFVRQKQRETAKVCNNSTVFRKAEVLQDGVSKDLGKKNLGRIQLKNLFHYELIFEEMY